MSSDVTLKHIAEELGISAMTVSRAINNRSNVDEKTKERVLKKAESMGYTPNHIAKSLVSNKTSTIGVVVPEIAHSFFAQAIQGMEKITYRDDYRIILTHSAEKEDREKYALETLRAQRVDGILISSAEKISDYEVYKSIVRSGIKLVFFDRCVEYIGASCIQVDDRVGSKKIMQHLVDHGYKRIAHLRGPMSVSIGKERLEGYKEALKENDLPVDESLIIESGFTEKGGYEAMKNLLEAGKDKLPDAVFAVNDPSAFGAMDAIEDHGLSVPDDIAIVGFSDDIRAGLMAPSLTTVRQPAYQIGKIAADKLIRLIENENEPVENIEVKTELVIRESCGCS
jgi:DNA-binding LacI/PurR family transcriptional regulator